ncbi:ankyrin repeat-containing protein At2g01680-like [Phragmites australis]|uniref:ankyrin repeat-containing protein At2g01680-like n=1 Tax=Phragmites australis TaxID=29695 RepID=UPI002D796B69|nr:ankyrin repeat-containing protein At2g01680-like [Phragmites australis]
MASSNTAEQSGSLAAVENVHVPTPMHPELLMAASHGCHEQLTSLLNREDQDAAMEHRPRPNSMVVASPAVVVEIDNGATASSSVRASSFLHGVTPDGDSALHVVAAAGNGDGHLKNAKVIYDKARHLLGAPNRGGNTPLHRASRAGNVAMLSLLVDLARAEEEVGGSDNEGRVEAILRVRNGIGETVLHEAIRAADTRAVDVLMTADPCLARVPDNGTSPLFLAISLCRYGIARELYARDNRLSYSGPDGQTALHAAVLRSKEMTELLLGWNKQLAKQQDEHGNTPLHFALSLESETFRMLPLYAVPVKHGKSIGTLLNITEPPLELTKQLLEADAYSAYQPDKNGSFPIHIAASAGRISAVIIFLSKYSGCAGLRDSHGRTFLHVAIKNKRYDIVRFACQTPALSSILNKQDNDGNSALHLAVEVGHWWIFACLFVNKQVDLNLPNNSQHTPRELSISSIPTGLYCLLNSRILIQETLRSANATRHICRRDDGMEKEHNPLSEAKSEEKGSQIVSDSTQFLSVGLVLITTMAFGATFALPGGYRADDHSYGGTPTLAQSKQFQGFLMANTLAFFCSSLAVLSLVFAGTPTVELPMRYMHYNISIWLSLNAVGSLAIAFAIAVYIMITPVAAKTALAVIVVIVSIGALHAPSIIEKFCLLLIVLCVRVGILPVLRSSISKVVLLMCWPLIVIFGWQEFASRY